MKEDVEVAAWAIGNTPTQKLMGFDGADERREERVGQACEDVDFPAGAVVGVELVVAGINGGFLEELESEGGFCRGVGGGIVDEEDGSHATFSEGFECSEVVEVELRRRWSCCRFHIPPTEWKGKERK